MDKEIKIHVLQCGTVGTDETIADRSQSKNPLATHDDEVKPYVITL